MKKLFLPILLILTILTSTLAFSNEKYILKDSEKEAINKVYDNLKIEMKTEVFQKNLVAGLEGYLNKFELYGKNYEIISALANKIKSNYETENEQKGEKITNNPNENNNQQSEENLNNDSPNQDDDSNSNNSNEEDENEDNLRVNFAKVKETWTGRQNQVRSELGLSNYNLDTYKLEKAANEWSQTLLERGDLDVMSVHKRDLSDSYYDYNKISSWLKDRGIQCKNDNKYTFSESIAWTSYYCSPDATDCTYEFIDGLRVSFDRYLAEKDKTEDSRPHYNAIINKYFKRLGLGLAIKEKSANTYEVFVTTLYCTELEE